MKCEMITVFTKPKRTKERKKKGTTTLEYYFSEILNIIEKQHMQYSGHWIWVFFFP